MNDRWQAITCNNKFPVQKYSNILSGLNVLMKKKYQLLWFNVSSVLNLMAKSHCQSRKKQKQTNYELINSWKSLEVWSDIYQLFYAGSRYPFGEFTYLKSQISFEEKLTQTFMMKILVKIGFISQKLCVQILLKWVHCYWELKNISP